MEQSHQHGAVFYKTWRGRNRDQMSRLRQAQQRAMDSYKIVVSARGSSRSTSGAALSTVARPVAAERYVRHTVKEPYYAIASNGCCTMQPVWQRVASPGRTQIFSWGQANVQLQMHARCWLSRPLWTRMRLHGLCYQAQDAKGTSRALEVHGMHHFRKQPLRRIGCSMAEQPRSTP